MTDEPTKGRGGRPLRAKGTGTAEFRNGHWWTKVSLPDGTRPRYRLCLEVCTCSAMSEAMVAERCQAISERKRAKVSAEMTARNGLALAKRMSVRELGKAWTTGELLEAHGKANKLKVKASAGEDRYRLRWAYEVPLLTGGTFGDRQVSEVTEADAQRVMAKAPGLAHAEHVKEWRARDEETRGDEPTPWRPATELQLYQALHRLFELASIPCRLRPRSSNPFTKELRPVVPQGDLIFQWLYPDEMLALLRCPEVPLVRRVLYTLAIHTGQRKESLRAIRWRHVDFDHSVLTSPKQKNSQPLTFDISTDLRAVLEAWRAHEGGPVPSKPLIGRLGCRWSRLPEQLRADLLTAGVTRSALQGGELHEEPLRFHDLRSTMVVWALKDPTKGYGWATDRTGHLTPGMLKRYDRAARNWREARFAPFPALVTEADEQITCVIPELSRQLSHGHLRAVV